MRWVPVVVAVLLSGCGGWPFGTPRDLPRPEFPDPEPFPDVMVEDVVEELERRGFACDYDPGGDIASGWACSEVDPAAFDGEVAVGFRSAETGPMTSAAITQRWPEALDKAVLDREAARLFQELSVLVFPAAVQPDAAAILDRVAANHVLDVGGGFWMEFHRSSVDRRGFIRYHADVGT